jgi:hypothetical protein
MRQNASNVFPQFDAFALTEFAAISHLLTGQEASPASTLRNSLAVKHHPTASSLCPPSRIGAYGGGVVWADAGLKLGRGVAG